ncbi:rho GTPase-activating protein 23-like isoform X6 [Maniola hyperantus]|uniref:rho GTPase-activating protein 23-like isoform X6 n=1 Tax=Aphantopus hyperantus TaxID=2795564 RepID=UPI003747B9E5
MMQALLESLYKIYTDWRAPMTDEPESGRRSRAPPAPPPRASVRPEPRPRTLPPRLIRPSEHLAIVEQARERRPPPLVPSVTVIQGHQGSRPPPLVPSVAVAQAQPRPPPLVPAVTVFNGPQRPQRPQGPQRSLVPRPPPPPPGPRPYVPPSTRMPAPVPNPVMRLPQARRDVQPPQVVHAPPVQLPPPTTASSPPASHCSAPRTIVIQRPDARHGFGFTLRHLVVYPPESLQELYEDARHLAVGAVGAPMDTIFVRSVRPGGPAAAAGLRAGDRVLAVNGEPVACGRSRAPYARVVQLAQREPKTLRLTVVPRDHDLLQRYFSEAAYNPETNQRVLEMPAVTEHESRLFDACRRPRLPALPAPQAPLRHREDPEYATVAPTPSRFDVPRLPSSPHYLLHDGRRESDTSLPSSAAESKDSLGSFDSNSTLTGRELDDSIILSRIRKSLEQKEAFLRRPSQPTGWVTPDAPPPPIKQKEFYARPQKLQKPAWPPPPSSPPLAASPPPPLLQPQIQEQRKEECATSVDSGTYSGYGEVNGTHNDKSRTKQDKSQFVATLSKIQETSPSIQSTNIGTLTNGSSSEFREDNASSSNQDNRYPVPELQLVTARTRQLEEARGVGERRTEVARSELARLSTTRLEPSVALRRKEFETRTSRREARSLDVQPQQDLEQESSILGGSLSGNQLMITGSKHLHCPPPDGFIMPETEKVQMRTRSNSTGSEGLSIRRHHATGFADDIVTRRHKKDAHLGEEERAMRRVSYLKATWGDRLHLDSDVEPDADHHGLRSAYRKWQPPRFTEDITPLLRIFDPQATLPERPEKKGQETSESIESLEADVQGNVQVKMVVSNGKRASDRSWKQVWAVLQGTKLYLYRNHPTQSPGAVTGSGTGTTGAEGGSRDALDVRYSLAALADDYTKRKHVVRVTTAAGAELLLQAEGAADAQRWLAALRRHSAEPPPIEPASLPPPPSSAPPTTTTAPECPSPLPPQRSKKIGRNRSPTGPPTPTLPSSPKNKTWKGRMAKQLRRMHGGATTPAPAAATGWLGAPLDRCPADAENPLVPKAVTLPAQAVEAYGLRTVGVYRVPGNAAGVAALAAALDRGEPPPAGDARWADVHVASSLLKAYLRRLPDPILTAHLYPAFIAADRSPERARELRRLVHALPEAHYETLKYLIQHLRRVVAHSAFNKMEARNLAIVFGPTLVRATSDDMLAMVNDMSSQCRIIESFLTHYPWYFEDEEDEPPRETAAAADQLSPAPAPSRDLLIHNVKKIEGKDVSTRDIVSSIISAANRKIQRKPRKSDKKWEAPRSPGTSPPRSPLTSPPAPPAHTRHVSLPHFLDRHHDQDKIEMEAVAALARRQDISRHTLNNFSIDGAGDLVSSLTSTFDQKLRTLNNSSPLDDGSIPYADECQDDDEGKSSGSSPSDAGSVRGGSPVRARADQLKAAWLRSASSSSDEPDARAWPPPRARAAPHVPPADDDSEKENCGAGNEARHDDEKDVDTRSQSSGEPLPDNDKPHADCAKRAGADAAAAPGADDERSKVPREAPRVLRSESLNCRPQRSESLGKGERLGKAEKGEWNAVRRREAGAWRSTKLKRKNGMPERGIKRRHTVGGTKDFDKDGWAARHTRTSSPDLTAAWLPAPRAPLESHV